MKSTKYVFIIVVYINTEDLKELILNIKSLGIDHEIVIVCSYYDDDSTEEFRKISSNAGCDFIVVENRGYGYGNNRGIEYARNLYHYEYIIISNPDVIIEKFDEKILLNLSNSVVGPVIETPRDKFQNPYWVVKNSFTEWLIYYGYKMRSKILLYTGIALNKILRIIFLGFFYKSNKRSMRVFALHGCFVIYPKEVIEKIRLPYDEEMFLFAEEAHIAHLLDKYGVKSYLSKEIKIFHKEDGSMIHSSIDEDSELRKSVMKYYEKLK